MCDKVYVIKVAYYSLPTGKLHKKTETKKLDDLPS